MKTTVDNTLEIPVKSYILKFLQRYLGAHYFLSESDPYGLFLFQLMRRPVTDARKDEVVAKYKDIFAVNLGSYSASQYGLRGLTGKTVYQFNNFVDGVMRQEFYSYVDVTTDFGISVKFSIECFMQKYGFDETDIPYDTLLKSYQRFSQDQKAAKKKVTALTPRKALKQLQRDLTRVVAGAHQVPTVVLQPTPQQSL